MAIGALLQSRKFLLLLFDTVLSLATLIGGWFLAPELLGEVAAVIAILQPVFIMIIYTVAKEDVAAYEAGVIPRRD
jgi:hypothetical protein